MRIVVLAAPLSSLLLGCLARPDVTGVLRDCPASAGAVLPVVATAELRPGDQLVYEWVSKLGAGPERARVTVEVGAIDAAAPAEAFDPSDERLDGLPALIAAIGDLLGRDLEVVGPRTLRLPTGRATFTCAVETQGHDPAIVSLDLPVACRGHGLLSTAALLDGAGSGGPVRLGWQAAAEFVLGLAGALQLCDSPELAACLPGAAECASELLDPPSPWRVVTGGLFLRSLRVECPSFRGEPLGDGRVRVPFALAWGAHALAHGVVELAPPRGALCLTSGVVGVSCWRPGAPERNVTLRLVAVGSAAAADG